MLSLLAQTAAQTTPPQPPIVNISNIIPASNPWPAIIGTLAGALVGALAGLGGQWLAHRFTSERDRRQKLRDGYAAFSGALFNLLEYEKGRLQVEKQLSIIDELRNRAKAEDAARDAREAKLSAQSAAFYDKIDLLKLEAQRRHCALVLLLGFDKDRIKSLDDAFERIQKGKYRIFPFSTKTLPSKKEYPSKSSGFSAATLPARDKIVRTLNMEMDLTRWFRAQAECLAQPTWIMQKWNKGRARLKSKKPRTVSVPDNMLVE